MRSTCTVRCAIALDHHHHHHHHYRPPCTYLGNVQRCAGTTTAVVITLSQVHVAAGRVFVAVAPVVRIVQFRKETGAKTTLGVVATAGSRRRTVLWVRIEARRGR